MDNPETLATQGTQDTSRGQQTLENTEMDNPEKLAIRNGQSNQKETEKLVTQGTQDTSRGQQTLENTERAIRNGQS